MCNGRLERKFHRLTESAGTLLAKTRPNISSSPRARHSSRRPAKMGNQRTKLVSLPFLGHNVQTRSIRHIRMKVIITLYDVDTITAFFPSNQEGTRMTQCYYDHYTVNRDNFTWIPPKFTRMPGRFAISLASPMSLPFGAAWPTACMLVGLSPIHN